MKRVGEDILLKFYGPADGSRTFLSYLSQLQRRSSLK